MFTGVVTSQDGRPMLVFGLTAENWTALVRHDPILVDPDLMVELPDAPGLAKVLILGGVTLADVEADMRTLGLLPPGVRQEDRTQDPPDRFVCPACLKASSHPKDVRAGYCGACHDWTGDPDVWQRVLEAAFASAVAGQVEKVPPYRVGTGAQGEFVTYIPWSATPLERWVVAGDVRRRFESGVGFDDLRVMWPGGQDTKPEG